MAGRAHRESLSTETTRPGESIPTQLDDLRQASRGQSQWRQQYNWIDARQVLARSIDSCREATQVAGCLSQAAGDAEICHIGGGGVVGLAVRVEALSTHRGNASN
jgi:hypothetical protein